MRRAPVLTLLLLLAFALAAAPARAQDVCGPVETTVDEGHQHLLGDAPPPTGYRTTPPASGWHYRERDRVRLGVLAPTDPLTEPEHVTVLAVGGVVVSHGALDPDQRAALVAVVEETGRTVTLTAYDALADGEVALSAWRTVQRCSGVDPDAVRAFVSDHAAATPDYTMSASAAHAAPPAPAQAPSTGNLPPWALGTVGVGLVGGFGLALSRRRAQPREVPERSGESGA